MAIDAFPLTAHEEREMGADMQVACMFVLDLSSKIQIGSLHLKECQSGNWGDLPPMPGPSWVLVLSS
jgi:hypothetical protein